MIYKVERTDHGGYDEYDEVVVRAHSVVEALKLVLTGNEYEEGMPLAGFRADGSNAKVTPVSPIGKAEIITTSFNAG